MPRLETILEQIINPQSSQKQVIKMDVSLMIRLFELCREQITTDVDLHKLADNISNKLSDKSKDYVLTIDDYPSLIEGIKLKKYS